MLSLGTEYSPKDYIRQGYEFLRDNNMQILFQFATILSAIAFVLIFFFPSVWTGKRLPRKDPDRTNVTNDKIQESSP